MRMSLALLEALASGLLVITRRDLSSLIESRSQRIWEIDIEKNALTMIGKHLPELRQFGNNPKNRIKIRARIFFETDRRTLLAIISGNSQCQTRCVNRNAEIGGAETLRHQSPEKH